MMTFLATKWAVLSVKKYALANMRLHIAFSCSGELASTVAERATGVGNLNRTPSAAKRAIFYVRLIHTDLSLKIL